MTEAETMVHLANDAKALATLSRQAAQGATDDDLGAIFGVPGSAIRAQHGPLLQKARAELRCRIRRGLLMAGDRGDVAALSYLAKVYLLDHDTDEGRAIAAITAPSTAP